MNHVAATDSAFRPTRRNVVFASFTLIAAVFAVYANSFRVPFLYDDVGSITENPTIRSLKSAAIWSPPAGLTVSGRPVLNASFAANYAIGGLDVGGYHLANVAIHALVAIVLFAILRRTFEVPRLRDRFGRQSAMIAFAGALAWALHPLQTESVTYIVQRAEALMALFYVLTVYCFIRATVPPGVDSVDAGGFAARWRLFAVVCCAAGMATKEVMVTAPLLIILYDRVFVAGSFREVLKQRWRFHAALGATWFIAAWLAWRAGDRGGTAGLTAGIEPWRYALSQTQAVLHYVRLAVWPFPQVFDYGPFHLGIAREYVVPALVATVALVAITGCVRRHPAAVFGIIAFLLVLAPTSTVLPIVTEVMAEHRLYLALAGLIPAALAGAFVVIGRSMIPLALSAAAMLGLLTSARNGVYRSEEKLWTDTISTRPNNPRAHYCLAVALLDHAGDARRAEAELRSAIALEPRYLAARLRLAELLSTSGRAAESATSYETIIHDYPDNFVAHNALGLLAFERRDFAGAAGHFQAALHARPNSAVAHNNLGGVLYEMGDFENAASHEQTALQLDPAYAEAAYNLGNALAQKNLPRAALERYEQAIKLQPDYAAAHANLASVLMQLGDKAGAISHFQIALRLRPDFAFAKQRLDELTGPSTGISGAATQQ
jgi:protein O-mannosyl-transferase